VGVDVVGSRGCDWKTLVGGNVISNRKRRRSQRNKRVIL
jgi:hypothetical protein